MDSDFTFEQDSAPVSENAIPAPSGDLDKGHLSTLAMRLSYIGSPFCGFARQPGQTTVQGEIETALSTVFRREILTVCAGRTDSGVHAKGQVVSFELFDDELSAKGLSSLERSVNALTCDGISARKIVVAPPGFSARFDARTREYRYRLFRGAPRPLFMRDFTWDVGGGKPLDLNAMREGAALLVGEHDFKSFCVAASAVGKNTVREILSIDIYEEEQMGEPGIVVRVVGNAFLHSMVRTLVGTLCEVGCGRRRPEWVGEVLERRDRSVAGQTAPAHGLVLWDVDYGDRVDWDDGRE